MSRLTLRLPETLHQQLSHLADDEGVSLNQYIVYALTRQVTSAYSIQAITEVEVEQQKQSFEILTKNFGKASSAQIEAILSERDRVEPEAELSSETIDLLQARIRSR